MLQPNSRHTSENKQGNSKPAETVNPFPKYLEEFCPILLDRLHTTVERFYALNNEFSLSLYMKTAGEIRWVAVDKQRELFEKRFPLIIEGMKGESIEEYNERVQATKDRLDFSWKKLKNAKIEFEPRFSQAAKIFELFDKGTLRTSDIIIPSLYKFFNANSRKNSKKAKWGNVLEAERKIFNTYFNINQDEYISFPLFGFGELVGIVTLTTKTKRIKAFKDGNGRRIHQFIKFISEEYENMLLDWEVVGENIYEKSIIDIEQLKDPEQFENEIFRQLKFPEYYAYSEYYLKKRIEQLNIISLNLIAERRKDAITAILIDSFAHNISAHSLTALTWWFRQRGEGVNNKIKIEEFKKIYPLLPVITSKKPLANEIYPLLRFILEKGAFWNGITRDIHFGGQIRSLYKVLFEDFANNPLYLGSIAYSEGILKININITILNYRDKKDNKIERVKNIAKNKKGELLTGTLVKINLTNTKETEYFEGNEFKSDFVAPGNEFDILKEALLKKEVFFPGAVVGKHAFFTTLETEIRNIKHFKPHQIEQIKDTGLNLNISIEDSSYKYEVHDPRNYEFELFKVGIWLGHPQPIGRKDLEKKLERNRGDIISKSFSPNLGGSYQDKVCAALLFNNSFTSVQNEITPRDKIYYPWVKTGFRQYSYDSLEKETVSEIEISEKIIGTETNEYKNFISYFQDTQTGYLKKYLRLWQGKSILQFKKEGAAIEEGWENLSRFRFVNLTSKNSNQISKLRKAGIVRIIYNSTVIDVNKAYGQWLPIWVGKLPPTKIIFLNNNVDIGQLVYEDGNVSFLRKEKIKWFSKNNKKTYQERFIPLIHNKTNYEPTKTECRYRKHGILIRHFCEGSDLSKAKISQEKASELFEVLMTKVLIFDNRMYKRIEFEPNKEILAEELNCQIQEENLTIWKEIRENDVSNNFNFLVMHLSFIETMKDKNGDNYGEENINAFIEEEIRLNARFFIPENFILVITSGRGRTQWWEKLDDEYKRFTTFKPIESLISSLELALQIKDDIELKYRLIKILFGS